MLCHQCQDLFSGQIYYRDIWEDFILHRDLAPYSLTGPTLGNDCTLCSKIYEHSKNNYEVTKLLQQPGGEPVFIRVRLEFEMTGGAAIYRGILTGSIDDDPEPCHVFEFILSSTSDPEIAALLYDTNLVPPTTDSPQTFRHARTWLEHCVENHLACKINKGEAIFPSRLLKLNAPMARYVQLYDTSVMKFEPPYMTLSHSWGVKKFLTLTATTQQELRGGIDVGKLAQTFQDAIRIAVELGAQYLWIDSLCIFQDSKDDWSHEAPLMAAIYQGSTCNIGASASRSAYDGCFRTRDASMVPPMVITTSYINTSMWNAEYLVEVESYDDMVHEKEQPLFSRGWVFQERVLSPRMLHFGSEYVFWECKTSNYSERYPNGYPDSQEKLESIPVQLSKEHEEKRFNLWATAVSDYSSLSLTYPADRLIAISGVAKHLQTLVPSDKYLAGLVGGILCPCGGAIVERTPHPSKQSKSSFTNKPIPLLQPEYLELITKYSLTITQWNKDFLRGLQWYSHDSQAPYGTSLTAAQSRPVPYQAPTWSWGSTIGQVKTCTTYQHAEHGLCTIENVTLHHNTHNIYGNVLYGVLKVKGHLLKCTSFYLPREVPDPEHQNTDIHLISMDGSYSANIRRIMVDLDSNLDSHPRSLKNPALLASPLYLFPMHFLYGMTGILMLPTAEEGCYERCGAVRVSHPSCISLGDEHSFWVDMKARATARKKLRPEDDPFDITYLVGPKEEKQDATPVNWQPSYEGWKEYEDFDGEDYTFSII